MQLQPKYIIDSQNRKVGVQLDIKTYDKIVKTLENHALFKFMEMNQDEEKFSIDEAKKYYQSLKQQ
jgi:hypothetical protein